LVFSLTLFKTSCDSIGSCAISQIVSNLKLSIFIFHKYFSIELINLIIFLTSSCDLFFKLSVERAHKVIKFIQILSACSAIFTTLSAPALCQAKIGKNLDFAHLLFQSIIIQM